MNRLFEIASELGEIARSRFALKQGIIAADLKIAARKTALIPVGGWPGSNADTRKAAEETAKAADPELTKLTAARDVLQSSLDELEVKREVLVAERDAWQWTIRDMEAVGAASTPTIRAYSVFEQMEHYEADQRAAEALINLGPIQSEK